MSKRISLVYIGAPASGKSVQALRKAENGYYRVTRDMVMGPKPVELLRPRVRGRGKLVFDFWPLGRETSTEFLDYLLSEKGEVHFIHLTIDPILIPERIAKQRGLKENDPALKQLVVSRMRSYNDSFQEVHRDLRRRATSWTEADGSLSEHSVYEAISEAMLVNQKDEKGAARQVASVSA